MYLIMRRQGTETNITGWTVCFRSENEAVAQYARQTYYSGPEYILVQVL